MVHAEQHLAHLEAEIQRICDEVTLNSYMFRNLNACIFVYV